MGVLNVTPDSFYDGGRYATFEKALRHAERMVEEGADYVDVGGESTRPGAEGVSEAEELDRVVAVVEAIRQRFDVALSVDTSRPAIILAACAAGATLVNDVRALAEDGALAAALEAEADIGLMHMLGKPRTMQVNPEYTDVVADVAAFLDARAQQCLAAGVRPEQLLIDPGIGFGKTLTHNLELLQALPRLTNSGFGVLLGVSRKSMFGQLLGAPAERRLYASLAVAIQAANAGVAMLRVHDVAATVESLAVWSAIAAPERAAASIGAPVKLGA